MSLKEVWKDSPREMKVIAIVGMVMLPFILITGFIGEYQDWDGEKAAKRRSYVGDQGYKFKCIKECVACHAKVGYPLNKNMKHNLSSPNRYLIQAL